MRRLWLTLGALICLFLATLWNTHRVDSISEKIALQLEAAQISVESGDWTSAQALTDSAQMLWEEVNPYLAYVLRHADTDDVSTTFKEVSGYLQWHETAEYISLNSALTEKVRHLADMERLSWENLL